MRTPRIEIPAPGSALSKSWYQSLFWPLEFVLLCLGASMAFHLYDLNEDRLATLHNIHTLTPRGEAALNEKKRFIALVQEIGRLGRRDKAAADLLASFNITFRPDATDADQGK